MIVLPTILLVDDDAYMNKLMEPYILKYENSLFDGTYVAAGLLHWLVMMGFPLMIGLESRLHNVRIDDQTMKGTKLF